MILRYVKLGMNDRILDSEMEDQQSSSGVRNASKIRRILFWGSIAIYLLALTQKTYCVDGDCGDDFSGLANLLMGGLALLFVQDAVSLIWLANPLFWVAWLSFRRNATLSLICIILGLSISLCFLFFDEILINEAGHYGQITGYATGYWLWVLSFVLLLVAVLIPKENKVAVST